MRTREELVNNEDPGWPRVVAWIASATNRVEVLPAREPDRGVALTALQVTTRSPMGAIVYETGGLLIDGGWLRILGSGHPRLPRSLPGWNDGKTTSGDGETPAYLLVADDAVGGFFAINGGGLGPERGTVYYFAPDTLGWQSLDVGYSEFVIWCMGGDVGGFYRDLRWPGWESEVADLGGDYVIGFYPFLWAKGPPLQDRFRKALPISEVYGLNLGDDA